MAEIGTPMHQPQHHQCAVPPPQPPTTTQPHRRPRVREVSSRFMSGLTATSPKTTPSSSPLVNHHSLKSPRAQTQRSSSVQRQRQRRLDLSDENAKPNPEITRSFETPLALGKSIKPHHHHNQRLASSKPLRRPDTPISGGTSISSRSRSTPLCQRSTSAAEKLLMSSGLMAPSPRNQQSGVEEEKQQLRSSMPTLLPPVHPSVAKGVSVTDARKGRNSGYQEDVHTLRLLHNRYLQLRFANAKAEASLQSQTNQARRKLYSLAMKISDLYDSAVRKRIELQSLAKANKLCAVLETQMPYLEEWSALEPDYSVSVSEAIQALLNACLHLPISGNVKVNTVEVKEAMNSAVKVMEMIALHVENFIPKAEKMDILMSELAGIASGEMSLIEECGNRLTETYISQVEESSLKCQLMQLDTNDNTRSSLA